MAWGAELRIALPPVPPLSCRLPAVTSAGHTLPAGIAALLGATPPHRAHVPCLHPALTRGNCRCPARRYLDARGDPQLQRLRQLSHSPVAWFRSPLVHIVICSCGEYEEYRRDLRLRLKAMADTETAAPASPELLFVYVRPPAADATAKGPARVFDAMRKDLNRRRERCVRLDPQLVGAASEPGVPGAWAWMGWGVSREPLVHDCLGSGVLARAPWYVAHCSRGSELGPHLVHGLPGAMGRRCGHHLHTESCALPCMAVPLPCLRPVG